MKNNEENTQRKNYLLIESSEQVGKNIREVIYSMQREYYEKGYLIARKENIDHLLRKKQLALDKSLEYFYFDEYDCFYAGGLAMPLGSPRKEHHLASISYSNINQRFESRLLPVHHHSCTIKFEDGSKKYFDPDLWRENVRIVMIQKSDYPKETKIMEDS